MIEWPSVSVIIPAHRRDYGLERCLDAVLHQTYEGRVEILVANDGASSEVAQCCRDRGVVSVPSLPAGSSYRSRNAALAVATGDVIAFTDSNKFPDPRWLEEGVSGLMAADADYGSGPIVTLPHPQRGKDGGYWIQKVMNFPAEEYLKNSHFGVTGNLFVTRHGFRQIGPFEDGKLSGGDLAWGHRAYEIGLRQQYLPHAQVTFWARSFDEFRTKQKRVLSGRLRQGRAAGQSFRSLLPVSLLVRVALGRDTVPGDAAKLPGMTPFRLVHVALLSQILRWSNLLYSLQIRLTHDFQEKRFY